MHIPIIIVVPRFVLPSVEKMNNPMIWSTLDEGELHPPRFRMDFSLLESSMF
jgi:hypothetical protein